VGSCWLTTQEASHWSPRICNRGLKGLDMISAWKLKKQSHREVLVCPDFVCAFLKVLKSVS